MSPAPPARLNKTGASYGVSKQSLHGSAGKSAYEMDRDRIGVWGSGDGQANNRVSGLERLKHPGLNKVRTSP